MVDDEFQFDTVLLESAKCESIEAGEVEYSLHDMSTEGVATFRFDDDISKDGEHYSFALLDIDLRTEWSGVTISLGSPSEIREFAEWLYSQADHFEDTETTPEDIEQRH